MHYVAMRFPRYEERILDNKLYLLPCYGPKDNVLEKPSASGQRILTSLYRLYGEINKQKQKTPYTELIKSWCSKNMHPYDCALLYNMLTDKAYKYTEDAESIHWEGRFSVDRFMEELTKLSNHFGFYLALEFLKDGDTERAYKLYQEGRFTDTYPLFERFKHKLPEYEQSGKVSDDPRKQLLAEMKAKPINEKTIKDENDSLDKAKRFAMVPKAYDPELQFALLDMFPSFQMRIKALPGSDTVTFATDVNSVFDIAWYAFARLLITDVSEKDNYRIFKPKVCKYCGEIFSPNGPRQEYCDEEDNPECRLARKRKNRQDCDARKRQAKQEGKKQ